MAIKDNLGRELAVGDRVTLSGRPAPEVPSEVVDEPGVITEITQRYLVRVRLDSGYPLKKPMPPSAVVKLS